jgi:hypothetical protein
MAACAVKPRKPYPVTLFQTRDARPKRDYDSCRFIAGLLSKV